LLLLQNSLLLNFFIYNEHMKTKARTFAIEQHGTQMYGDKPYVCHLDKVAEIVETFMPTHWSDSEKNDALVLAYLHDVGEDTKVSAETLIEEFDQRMEQLVDNISDAEGAN